jgi:hypothetical protein
VILKKVSTTGVAFQNHYTRIRYYGGLIIVELIETTATIADATVPTVETTGYFNG